MKDRLVLRGIQVYGYHGVMPQEKQLGQRFRVNVTLMGDFSKAARSDSLDDALDYSGVHSLVCEAVGQGSFDLIEAVAGHLCTVLLQNLPIDCVEVTVEKTNPPIPGFTGQALVTLVRGRDWLGE
jgi:dihydroneopterin aldolase